jgi:hypothetical protein
MTVSVALVPGLCSRSSAKRSSIVSMERSSRRMITSPRAIPALAAGPPGTTSSTRTPRVASKLETRVQLRGHLHGPDPEVREVDLALRDQLVRHLDRGRRRDREAERDGARLRRKVRDVDPDHSPIRVDGRAAPQP